MAPVIASCRATECFSRSSFSAFLRRGKVCAMRERSMSSRPRAGAAGSYATFRVGVAGPCLPSRAAVTIVGPMTHDDAFDLGDFLPYLLNRAAEETSLGYEVIYRERYGMLRTEWRVLFHLGRHGEMTARDICDRARLHKTKVSRAVSALESKRFLTRATLEQDRRLEALRLSASGSAAYRTLSSAARRYDASLAASLEPEEERVLRQCLSRLANL